MNYEWIGKKPFRKNRSKKIEKMVKMCKNQGEIAACEQKTTNEKANFCSNIVSSLYFKIRTKFHAAKPLAFCQKIAAIAL